MDSSDDTFAWTSASSISEDSDATIDPLKLKEHNLREKVPTFKNENKHLCNILIETPSKMDAKVKVEYFSHGETNSPDELPNVLKRHIKKEKKKRKKERATPNESQDSNDEYYLNIKVKQEQAMVSDQIMDKKFTNKNELDLDQCFDNLRNSEVKKKKKKKHKRSYSVDESNISTIKQEHVQVDIKYKDEDVVIKNLEQEYNSNSDGEVERIKNVFENVESFTKIESKNQTKKRKNKLLKNNLNSGIANRIQFENENNLVEAKTNTSYSKENVESIILQNNKSKSSIQNSESMDEDSYYSSEAVKDIIKDKFCVEETAIEMQPKIKMKNHISRKSKVTNQNYSSKEFIYENTSTDDDNCTRNTVTNCINNSSAHENMKSFVTHSSTSDVDIDNSEAEISIQYTEKQGTKMADRIRFENEDNLDNNISTHAHHSDIHQNSFLLKKFLKANTELQYYDFVSKDECLVTDDDEIWLLKCPNGVNMTAFVGKELSLDCKGKIKIEGQSYESFNHEEKRKIAVLFSNHNKLEIKNMPMIGSIIFRKKIPKGHVTDNNVMHNNQINFIPLPDTKCRHPLFGPNYKKAMKLPSSVKERLRTACDDITLRDMANKKKKKTKVQTDVDISEPSIQSTREDSKGKRKRKYSNDNEEPSSKKKRKTKYNLDVAETWDSEKAIEESLFNF